MDKIKALKKWGMGFLSGMWVTTGMITFQVSKEGSFTTKMPIYKLIIGLSICLIFSLIVHLRKEDGE